MSNFNHTKKTPYEAYKVFFEALHYHSPSQIIQKANDFFGLPVLLTDSHYKLISMCPDQEIGVEIYDTLHKKQILPPTVIKDYQKAFLRSTEPYYEPFYSDSGLVSDCPRIFGEIFSGTQVYGHFAIMMFDEPVYETDMECVSIMRDALTLSMVPPPDYKEDSDSRYLSDLLDPSGIMNLRLFSASAIEKKISRKYSLMVTLIGKGAGQYAFAAMNKARSPLQYVDALSTIYENCIVTLFGSVQGDHYTESEKKYFREYANSLEFSGRSGLSVPFEDLLTIPSRFYEAYLSAVTGKDQFSLFSDRMPLPLFSGFCSCIDPSVFVHPAIYQILEHDTANKTEYYATLRTYSLLLHNKERTASALHIHRNTLLYRLNRMAILFSLPLEDMDTALHLLNSFQILDSLESRHGRNDMPGCNRSV